MKISNEKPVVLGVPVTHSDWMLHEDLPMTPESVRYMLDECKASGWTKVYWRLFDGGRTMYASEHADPMAQWDEDSYWTPQDAADYPHAFWMLRPREERDKVVEGFSHLDYHNLDTLAEAVTYGHSIGLEIHAWLTINEDDHGWGLQSRFNKANPQSRWVRRDGTVYHSQQSFAFPEVQEYKLALVRELLEKYQIDGIFLDWMRTGDVRDDPQYDSDGVADFGYEELLVQSFKKHYDIDPFTIENSDERWVAWRAEPQTEFVRSVRKLMKSVNPNLSLAVMGQHPWSNRSGYKLDGNLRGLLVDTATWAREGLVDAVVAAGYYRDGGDAKQAYEWLRSDTQNLVDVWLFCWVPASVKEFERDVALARELNASQILYWEGDYIDIRENKLELQASMSALQAETVFLVVVIPMVKTNKLSQLNTEQNLYLEAKRMIPGGVQLLSKRPEMFAPEVWPPYFQEAKGIEIVTHDGRTVIDFTTVGIGSCLLGYAHPAVTEAVVRRVQKGAMSTLNAPEEVELARVLLELHPWAQQIRFARAGGEALAVAVRIARASTKRDVIAFCGYHGWQDWYLAANLTEDSALSGHLLPGLQPNGVPRALQGTALPFTYNDIDGLRIIVREQGASLAAVVMEPIRNRVPEAGFLETVRELCDQNGTKLIFDEVTTGFRFHLTGAHLKYGIVPDIAVYAKALGNGHPIAAIIGQEATMSAAEESFISSTYWTESVGPTAGLATLKVLKENDVPTHIEAIGTQIQRGINAISQEYSLPLKAGGFPALTTLSFSHPQGAALLTLFTIAMLERGYLAGGAFYPTLAHTAEHVEDYLVAARDVLVGIADAIQNEDIVGRLTTPVKHSGFARLN